MQLEALRPSGFRNLATEQVTWSGGVTLVVGDNGQGKTNVLEAVTVLGNLRSFRTASHRALTHTDRDAFVLEGVIGGKFGRHRLRQEVRPGPPVQRSLWVDGQPAEVGEYLSVFPVFALSGADQDLVSGPPQTRRSFIDRLAFLLDVRALRALREYRRTLRQRNAALHARLADDHIAAWEDHLATTAAAVTALRLRALDRLQEGFRVVHESLRREGSPEVLIAYRAEAWLDLAADVEGLASQFRTRYHETRDRDREAGHTLSGPHRHDLNLRAGGVHARDVLSAGQVKAAAAALRLAALREVEAARDERLPLVVDDVDAELDREAVERLVTLAEGDRQVIVSSAHDEFVTPIIATARRFRVVAGACRAAGDDGERP